MIASSAETADLATCAALAVSHIQCPNVGQLRSARRMAVTNGQRENSKICEVEQNQTISLISEFIHLLFT